jgi:hypothetical protein
VAIPTPPVTVDTPTVPTPATALATEQSPPKPSQTTGPSAADPETGGKAPDADTQVLDGANSGSTADSGGGPTANGAVAEESAAAAENGGG